MHLLFRRAIYPVCTCLLSVFAFVCLFVNRCCIGMCAFEVGWGRVGVCRVFCLRE